MDNSSGSRSEQEIISDYFHRGLTCFEILAFLIAYHGVQFGYRQLKRKLKQFGLCRNTGPRYFESVVTAVESEISGCGKDLGYRLMHKRIQQKYQLAVSREQIRLVLKHLDPLGVEGRKQRRLKRREYSVKGPNYLWHIDGWDKLKQFGFGIHGCIDGYSRKILWLEVASTNKDPFVICSYFARCIKEINGIPLKIRADRGTENVHVELMQNSLSTLNTENEDNMQVHFLYGKSTANQRIENWWSKFGMMGMTTWINHFKAMSDAGIIDTSEELDIQCIIFCYINLLRTELERIVEMWNTHSIRRSRNSQQPYGKPDVIYCLPELNGSQDYLQLLNTNELATLSEALVKTTPCCKEEFRELFLLTMDLNGKTQPSNMLEADDLLVYLLDTINYDLSM
ncbi:hypothetical protein SNE40_010196 [Patella caerulea]|uniref:Integrase core domain-containing protein n=1 Tax=Patella caerulea TaxID=87958 RepID=A0AAN8JXG9_PATCE